MDRVEASAGIAVLSSLVVALAIKASTPHAGAIAFGHRPFFGLRHNERHRSKAAYALLELIGTVQRVGQPALTVIRCQAVER